MAMPPPPNPPGPPPGPGGPWSASTPSHPVREHPDGTTVLVLGILGIVACGLIAPFAWVRGNAAKREIDAQPHVTWTNRGAVVAGRICGIIGTVLIVLWLLFAVVLVAAIAARA